MPDENENHIVRTIRELIKALLAGNSSIEIEGDLAKKVIKIKAAGPITWGMLVVFIVAIAATPAILVASGGTAAPAEVVKHAIGGSVAVAAVGTEATLFIIGMVAAGGGIGVFRKLRSGYRIDKALDGRIILKKV